MQEPIRVTFDWNADECVKATDWHFRAAGKSRSQTGWILVFGTAGGLMMTVPHLFPVGLALVAFGLYGAYAWWSFPAKVRKQFDALPHVGGQTTWEFTTDRVEWQTPTTTTSSTWARFPLAVRTPEGILLYENPQGVFHWLPVTGCEPDEFERLVALVRIQVPAFREVR